MMDRPAKKAKFCHHCDIDIPLPNFAAHLRSNAHKSKTATSHSEGVELLQSAFKQRLASFRIINPDIENLNFHKFFEIIVDRFSQLITDQLAKLSTIRVHLELFGEYYLSTQNIADVKSFIGKSQVVDSSTDLNSLLKTQEDIIRKRVSEFEGCQSGTYS